MSTKDENATDKTGTDAGNQSGDDEKVVFTPEQQAAINAMLASERREAELKTKAQYQGYEDGQKAISELAKIKEAQMSELDKANAAREKAEQEAKAALAQANETRIKAEFAIVASRLGVANPDDAFVLAERAGVEIQDGKVVGVEDAVKALIDSHRVVMVETGAANLNGGSGAKDGPGKVKVTQEMRETAEKWGEDPDVVYSDKYRVDVE